MCDRPRLDPGRRRVQQSLGGRASKHALTDSPGAGREGARPEYRRGALEMLRRTAVFLLLCALSGAAGATNIQGQTRVPPINFKQRTLANGLTVITAQERS